jgi:hypothetical protein
MKTMTCKQLGGACDEEFHADTFDEMVKLSQNHGLEMAQKGDEAHLKVMEKMREDMNDPEAMKRLIEETRKEFEALPEEN